MAFGIASFGGAFSRGTVYALLEYLPVGASLDERRDPPTPEELSQLMQLQSSGNYFSR